MDESCYRDIVEHLPAGVAVCSFEGEFLFCNRAYADFFGVPKERIIGNTITGMLPGDLLETHQQEIEKLRQGKMTSFLIEPSGDESLMRRKVFYIPLSREDIFLCFVSNQEVQNVFFKEGVDITIGTLNHYINNSLMVLLGKLEKVKKTAILDEVLRDIKSIQTSTDKIVKTLKELSRSSTLPKMRNYSESGAKIFDLDEKG